MMKNIDDLTHAQRERLAFIDFSLNYFGIVTRTDLIDKFQMGLAAATRDFSAYKEYAPVNMELVHQTKSYHRKSSFQPLFHHDANVILSNLSKGFGDGISQPSQRSSICHDAITLVKPSSDVTSVITRAISLAKAIDCQYVSLSSGNKRRVIVPHSLVSNGNRWHVRAYDRDTNTFRDFVATRFNTIELNESQIEDHEKKEFDKQWNRIVDLTLIAHPKLVHPEAIELDYQMTNGKLELEVRAALVGYFLNRWDVDCSNEHNLDANLYRLALKSKESIFGVENNCLAPGYQGV